MAAVVDPATAVRVRVRVRVIIAIGANGIAPNFQHLELCAGHKPNVIVAQSPNGWITNDLKVAIVKQWIQSPATSLGTKPSVMNADGHESNTKQEELSRMMQVAQSLFAITPAHCTAKGLQQLDLPGGLIVRFKRAFRRLIRKLCRQSMGKDVPAHLRGRILQSQVLRAAQMAAEEATDVELNIEENKKVGYFIDPITGFLQYDPLKTVNKAFFETSAAFGGGGAHGEAGAELVRNSTQRNIDAAFTKSRAEVEALVGAIATFEEPIMAAPTQTLSRKRKSMNAKDAIASSDEFIADLRRAADETEDKAEAKKAKREGKARQFSAKWTALVASAEAILAKHEPTSAADLGVILKVGELKALIVSRTGRTGHAKNNKDGAIASEAFAVLGKPQVTLAVVADSDSDSDDGSASEEE